MNPSGNDADAAPEHGEASLFEWLPIGAYRCSPDGLPTRVNQALASLHGYASPQDMLAALGAPDAKGWYVDAERRSEFRRRLLAEGSVQGFVSEIRRQRDGARLWASESAHLLRGPDGHVLGYQGTLEDVSERVQALASLQRSDELLRQLTRHFPGVVFRTRWPAQGGPTIDFISDGVRELYGIEPDEVLRDSTLLERMRHPDDHAWVASSLLESRRDGQRHLAQFRIVRPDGSVRWVQGTAGFVGRVGGDEIRTGAILDITAEREAADLRAQRDRAEAARKAQSAMLSRVSHELRTPLNAVLGFSQLLEQDPALPERQREWAQQIVRGGRHLLALVEDVLGLSAVQSGEARLASVRVSVAPLIDDALALVEELARRHGVTLRAQSSPGLAVLGDERRLRQALINLLSNAVKYNRPGGQVDVDATAHGAQVRLAVHDTGQGLDGAQIERLFQPFERLGAELGPVEGAGLGLVLARDLVQAMGGSIDVRSTPGEGSVFTLMLPAADAPTAAQASPAPPG